MPVSGNEESGIRSIARKSSASIAGIPIKKRYLLVCPPSPPHEEQSSHMNPSQESSHSNTSVVTTSSGLSDASKNYFSEEKKERAADKNIIQSDSNLSRNKPLEPSLNIYTGSLDATASEEKLIATEKSSSQIISRNTELQLAPTEAVSLSVEKELFNKPKVERDCEPQVSTIAGCTELSLGPKEPLVPSLADQNSGGSGQFVETLSPFSLNLSFSKGKSGTNCRWGKDKLNNDGPHLQASRSNWDLNTTMDAWEGSVGEAAAVQGAVGVNRLNATTDAQDMKPMICSDGISVAGLASGNQVLKGGNHNSNVAIPSKSPCQHYNSEDSLHLQLSPSCFQSSIGGEQSSSSSKRDSVRVIPNSNLSRVLVSSGHPNTVVGRGNVKSEPFDDSTKQDSRALETNLMGLCRSIKREWLEKLDSETLKIFNSSTIKVDPRFIKSEPEHVENLKMHKKTEGMLSLSGRHVEQGLDNQSCDLALTKSTQLCPSEVPTCSTGLPMSVDVSRYSGNSNCTKGIFISTEVAQNASGSIEQVALESGTSLLSEVHEDRESNVRDGLIHAPGEDENLNVGDPKLGKLKSMDEVPVGSCGDGEGSVRDGKRSVRGDGEESVKDGEGSASDEEKISILNEMVEDSYESDYESDGNHDLVATAMDTEQVRGEDDDYEDGEVREPPVHTDVEGLMSDKKQAEAVNCGDSDNKNAGPSGSSGANSPPFHAEEDDIKTEDPGETNNDLRKGCLDADPDTKTDTAAEKDICLDKSLTIEIPVAEPDKKRPIKPIRRKPLDRAGKMDVPKGLEPELSSDKAISGSEGTVVTVGQSLDQSIRGTDSVEKNESALPKTEASLNSDEANKDSNSGGTRSRIINLPRASYVSSSCKTRSIPGRSLPSRTGREKFTDLVPEGDKLHPQGRDEVYIDGSHKFLRERNQDQLLRNSRLSFTRGRGRGSSRLDTIRGDWDSEHDFPPELYNGPTDFRFRRHKAAVGDADIECSGYVIASDGAVGTGRGGRKPLNDEVSIFRRPLSRRRSPVGREGPSTRGPQMVCRIPRNISPNRCIGEEASDLVGLRHGEKFMRGLRDDLMEPMFPRQQPPFEGVEGHFVQGNRNFSSIQRRGPRIRSKSPIRSRSPGTWSSPRRRSPDAFNGHPELTHRRSPTLYRMDRMRSPDRSCFPEEIVARRHGSPPYLSRPSNDLRDMDSGRDHGPPRSVITHRRSPSGRILPRNGRRFDIIEPRERTDSEEFFGPPMHSGRFHDLAGDGNGEERRRIGERRGPVRSFRPPFNGGGPEGFRFNIEDGPTRPYRFCPEADSEFHERGNLREREFDRRIKNRPGNAPRRSIEDQEGNFGHGEQVWHDQGFDDISRLKRRRF